ncbi:MAG: chloride channel protein [Lysobacterales bacterium]
METNTLTEKKDSDKPQAAADVDQLHESKNVAARIRRQLNFSLLGLSGLAVILGSLVAYGAYGFRLSYRLFDQWVHDAAHISPGLSQLLLLTLGGLFFGLILKALHWNRFRGPADVIIAVHEHDGRLKIRDGVITATCDALALGLEASVGRYGPAVQLGATVGSILGRIVGLTRTGLRVLLGCGVAAAISASFNAPIAGVIFAHEVIIGHFSLRALAPITVASVVAVGVTRYHGFEYVALKLTEESLHLVVWEYAMYALLGLAAAGVALVYMNGILRVGDLASRARLPIWIQPAVGGALAGAIGWWIPEVLGLGEKTMQGILDPDVAASSYGIGLLALLCLAKLLASVSCLGFRYPGGVFSPALFMGAALGGLAGFLVPFLDYQVCVLVGMGALIASVIGAPLATILIVFELTENYQAATAVMIGVVAANALVTRFYARSIFHRQILRLGIDLERPKEQRLMAARQMDEIMSQNCLAVQPDSTVAELQKLVLRGHEGDIFVIEGESRRLLGRLPLARLVAARNDQTAMELCEPVNHFLQRSDDLWTGFLAMENLVGYLLPVVADSTSMSLVGSVAESDFISAYRQAVSQNREEQEGR